MRIFENINVDFLSKRKVAYIVSGTLILLGLISLFTRGLEFGIDFKGGTEIALSFEKEIDITDVRNDLDGIGLGNIEVKTFGDESGILVRTELQQIPPAVFPQVIDVIAKDIDKRVPDAQKSIIDSTAKSVTFHFQTPEVAQNVVELLLLDKLQATRVSQDPDNSDVLVRVGIADWIEQVLIQKMPDNPFVVQKSDNVGPKIGEELKADALISIGLALLVILVYLGFRFKFVFAMGAVVALFHDVFITLGMFSLLYGLVDFLNLEISINVVAAFLTLVGYSINDTVVVFDRIRENVKIHKTAELSRNINNGISSTLPRTIITSVTTFIVVLVLFIFGGEVLRGFAFTLTFGIIIGTYSSIFVASSFVYEYATKRGQKIQF